jgi:hypothetical protein
MAFGTGNWEGMKFLNSQQYHKSGKKTVNSCTRMAMKLTLTL